VNTIDDIRLLVGGEWQDFCRVFQQTVSDSDNELLRDVADHLLLRQGKQLRPLLVLLCAKLCGGVNEKTILTASAMEMLHTASLVHDDVVDNSPLRRGLPSVQARWTNKVAVLSGDYLLAKAIETTARIRNQKVLNIVANMCEELASGELLQLHLKTGMWISEKDYYKMIGQKTAALFAACTHAGAVSAGASSRQETALRTYGRELGMVFQMKDDLLDWFETEDLGKPTMSDIRDGKATLALLVSLQRAPKHEADEIRRLAESLNGAEPNTETEQALTSFVLRYDGIGYVRQQMELRKRRAIEALSVFHDSSVKAALIRILEFTISRVA